MSESSELVLTKAQDKTIEAFSVLVEEFGANSGYQTINKFININGEIRASVNVVAICDIKTGRAIREFIEDLARAGQFGQNNVHFSESDIPPCS